MDKKRQPRNYSRQGQQRNNMRDEFRTLAKAGQRGVRMLGKAFVLQGTKNG